MMAVDVIFGCLLLFAGRSLFWLGVGIIGFLIGVQCAQFLGYSDRWAQLVSAFALGSVGIVLAVSFEWATVIFGIGFLGGGYLLMSLFPSVSQQDPYSWLIFVAGGIAGMCLMVVTFDWTLILMSALLGATLIAGGFHGREEMRGLLLLASMVSGILVQYLTLRNEAGHQHLARRA